MRYLNIIFCILFLSACSTHMSPRQAPKGQQFLFVTNNEEAIFRAAYDAMNHVRPELPIVDMGGSVRGYLMTRVVLIDKYRTVIRIFRAEGEDASGRTIKGYYPEVSGSGTIASGPSNDESVYELALKKFGLIGGKKQVNELRRINYILERDRWRLHSKPSLRDGGSIKLDLPGGPLNSGKKSVQERLDELNRLRKIRAISEDEYKSLRKGILKDL
jgi:hypothetical protein